VFAKAVVMRLLTWSRRFALIALMTGACGASSIAQMESLSEAWRPDDSFELYAVTINYPKPFDRPSDLYGVYLGRGAVLTAAHVVSRRNWLVNPLVRIAAHEVSAKILKEGSFPQLDLALLSVDETGVPLKIRMRRNMPLCGIIPKIGTNVVVAYPDRIVRSHTISPALIGNLADRKRFATLIRDVQVSGSGVFDLEQRCLLGIMSASVRIHSYQKLSERAGYFVPALQINLLKP
jgi:trypsin-like peptidase